MSETGVISVLCSCPDTETANMLAEQLVGNHLAACVSVVPAVTSFYHWEGRLQKDSEALLVIKCAEHSWQELHDYLLRKHPYDNPEVIALPVSKGSGRYLDWIIDECAPPQDNRH
jgi:periplasmic divalent cation tolerance protein